MSNPPPLVDISAAMRTDVRRVFMAIGAFAALYAGLIIAALVLLAACVGAAAMVISVNLGYVTIAIAVGLLGLGVMFFAFLIKFVFARSKHDDPVRMEVTAVDQPELFAMIEEVARLADAPGPKHVYLVPEVNASVSYDSTFWSMVLPVRKNLRIGLGLVNALNVSELRAVLAHEFGHFSQRSMKLGSYVYTVNRTISDLVQHRDKWDDTLDQWAEAGGLFSIFSLPTFHLVQGVRGLLAKAYGWINKAYMGLSRQMEFHADAIAAQVAGGPALVSSLMKINYASVYWDNTLRLLGDQMAEGAVAPDVYSIQSMHVRIGRKLAEPIPDHALFEDLEKEAAPDRQRVRPSDEWDTHPALEDRAKNVLHYTSNGAVDPRSAWVLFSDRKALRERMSGLLYARATDAPKVKAELTPELFAERMAAYDDRFELDPRYAGFYDERHPLIPPADHLVEPRGVDTVANVFSAANVERMRKGRVHELDQALLRDLQAQGDPTAHFILDGQRVPMKEAAAHYIRFEEEGRAHQRWLKELDTVAWSVHRAETVRFFEEERFMEAYQALYRASELRLELYAIVELGGTIHDRLASQMRFTKEQWSPIAQDGERFEGRLALHFRDPSVMALLSGAENEVARKAMERLVRAEGGNGELEVERFIGYLQIASTALMAAHHQQREQLKRLMTVQAERLFGA